MDRKNGVTITNRDHVLRAWQNSTELVRDYQAYAHELEEEDKALATLFSEFAEEVAAHATKLLDRLRGYETSCAESATRKQAEERDA